MGEYLTDLFDMMDGDLFGPGMADLDRRLKSRADESWLCRCCCSRSCLGIMASRRRLFPNELMK